MLRVIKMWMAFAMSASLLLARENLVSGPVLDGWQLSMAVSADQLHTVINLTVENRTDSTRVLRVGTNFNNEDHWSLTATLVTQDGRTRTFYNLPRGVIAVTGRVSPVVIHVAPHMAYGVDLPINSFAVERPDASEKLSTLAVSGSRLQLTLHCSDTTPFFQPTRDLCAADLMTGWVTF